MNGLYQPEREHPNYDLGYAFWSQRTTTYQKFALNYTTITHDHDYALPIAETCYRDLLAFEARMVSGRRTNGTF